MWEEFSFAYHKKCQRRHYTSVLGICDGRVGFARNVSSLWLAHGRCASSDGFGRHGDGGGLVRAEVELVGDVFDGMVFVEGQRWMAWLGMD